MGVAGLLPLLRPVTKSDHVSVYRDRSIAIDGYAWLHKAVYGCCVELATGKENGQWIVYCLYFIDMLLSFNITVHMVFDGANLPAKRRTEGLREASRTEALKTALDLSKSMDFKERSLAHSYFSKAVDVTPRMAAQLIRILRKTRPKVLCTVAPYEADAQLGFLCKEGLVDAIISEDSDTIPYGCKEVLFKLKHDGTCETVVLEEVYGTFLPGLDLRAFTPLMTVALCVGAGCDYLEPLKGFGIKNSYKLISKHKSIAKMLWAMRTAGNVPPASTNITNSTYSQGDINKRTAAYELSFYQAVAVFQHQTIFDPRTRQTHHLAPLVYSTLPPCLQSLWTQESISAHPSPPYSFTSNSNSSSSSSSSSSLRCASNSITSSEDKGFNFLGALLDPALACAIADGLCDPISQTPFNLCEVIDPMLMGWRGSNNMPDSVTIEPRDSSNPIPDTTMDPTKPISDTITYPSNPNPMSNTIIDHSHRMLETIPDSSDIFISHPISKSDSDINISSVKGSVCRGGTNDSTTKLEVINNINNRNINIDSYHEISSYENHDSAINWDNKVGNERRYSTNSIHSNPNSRLSTNTFNPNPTSRQSANSINDNDENHCNEINIRDSDLNDNSRRSSISRPFTCGMYKSVLPPSYAPSSSPAMRKSFLTRTNTVYGNGDDVRTNTMYNGDDIRTNTMYGIGDDIRTNTVYGNGDDVRTNSVYGNGNDMSTSGVQPGPTGTPKRTPKFPQSVRVNDDDVIDITDDVCDGDMIDKDSIDGIDIENTSMPLQRSSSMPVHVSSTMPIQRSMTTIIPIQRSSIMPYAFMNRSASMSNKESLQRRSLIARQQARDRISLPISPLKPPSKLHPKRASFSSVPPPNQSLFRPSPAEDHIDSIDIYTSYDTSFSPPTSKVHKDLVRRYSMSLPPPLSPPSPPPTAQPLPDNFNYDKEMSNDERVISLKTTPTSGPLSKINTEQAIISLESIDDYLGHDSRNNENDDNCNGDHDDEFIDFYNYGDNDGSEDDEGSNDGDNNNSNTVADNIGNNHQLKSTITHSRVVLCGKEIVLDSSEEESVSTCSKVIKRRRTKEGI